MDTDGLSKEAYKAIILEAEKFSSDLALHYGLLSYSCKNEEDYISVTEELTKEIMTYNEAELDDLFFGNPPNHKDIMKALEKILSNLEDLRKIPEKKRHYDF